MLLALYPTNCSRSCLILSWFASKLDILAFSSPTSIANSEEVPNALGSGVGDQGNGVAEKLAWGVGDQGSGVAEELV